MKHTVHLLLCIVLISCSSKKEDQAVVSSTIQKDQPLTPLQLSVKAALTGIQKTDIEFSGNIIYSMDISGMEIVNISKKDYYIQQRNSQEADFNNYLKYMEQYRNNPAAGNPAIIADNKLKHARVIKYLGSMIQQASNDKEVYKVVYYLKANSRDIQYKQLQTTYLDADLKKMVVDYSHLQ